MSTADDAAEFLRKESLILVTAESCTAGLIAATLADVEGAGSLLDCAFVVYSPEAKQRCLGVNPQTIERFNLTSEEVAREMVLGALNNSHANVAVSNTGVTDDTDKDIPAGTQCFAWAFRETTSASIKVFSETRRFSGDRNAIRQASADYALQRISYYSTKVDTDFNWSDAPSGWRWAAQDEDGRWFWYGVKPTPGIGGGVWRAPSRAQEFACQGAPNPNWYDSLQERPE